ncbi:uncharacterized protein LOC115918643 [Strongylocentrotus purpuratus]|uniref:Peptidase S8/S53 domain-containing protein n=1 Tax=Strongylocentrotus purpuratus TaxID=7668 RepID=A0A7M7SYY1_STRPU|nr:uncharacterized protein LOC115918643 [Strongylocentrotus purpuratus]
MQWLSENVKWPGVALIGIGSNKASPSLDNAIHRIYLQGCMVVLPAGNNNSLACDSSPGRMRMPITVGATTRADYALYYSNHGSCVDIYAPGMDVEAAYYDGSRTAVESKSGTCAASAYVTGAVAMHMGNGMPPFKIKDYLLRHATEYQLRDVHDDDGDTTNKLLYVGKVSSRDADYKRPAGKKAKKTDKKKKDGKKDGKKGEKEGSSSTKDKTKTEL